MSYAFAMSARMLSVPAGLILLFVTAHWLRADEVNMENGDRYFGTVLSVSAETVVLKSEILGVLNVPRKKVASLAFGNDATAPKTATAAAPTSGSTNLPAGTPPAILPDTKMDLSAALRDLGTNTNFIGQIREQFLADNPGAASNYDALVGSLINGTLNLEDLRREARSSVAQLRELKRDLGPEAASSIDAYLEVLDNFLKETDTQPASAAPALQPKTPAR